MREVLILQFDAPLMSFGGVTVDAFGVIDRCPAASLLTGMFGNALGYDHRDFEDLSRLQSRLRFAVRCERRGDRLRDYQTVDLGQSHMRDLGAWTTWGIVDPREGGTRDSTHIRHRDYWADAIYVVGLALEPDEESPRLRDLADALCRPERPLFIGRKCCIPSIPIFKEMRAAETPLAALEDLPRSSKGDPGEGLPAWWDPRIDSREGQPMSVCDERDWSNQIHVGRRTLSFGLVHPPEAKHA